MANFTKRITTAKTSVKSKQSTKKSYFLSQMICIEYTFPTSIKIYVYFAFSIKKKTYEVKRFRITRGHGQSSHGNYRLHNWKLNKHLPPTTLRKTMIITGLNLLNLEPLITRNLTLSQYLTQYIHLETVWKDRYV